MSAPPTSVPFGTLPGGDPVSVFSLRGAGGLVAEITPYGAIVTRLLAPDRQGNLDDVVLGFDCLEDYVKDSAYMGAMVGRVAGRIPGAHLGIDGRDFKLERNQPPHHLHGGFIGFNKRLWTVSSMESNAGSSSLRLSYRSFDGEEGYPGTVDVAVTYRITDDSRFVIETEATTDKPTPVSLTNHSYFNLAGAASASIEDHELQIHSDEIVAVDENMTLLGQRIPVAGQPCDFNSPRRLGDVIPRLHQQHGDLYLLPGNDPADGDPVPVASVIEPVTGRILSVSTTQRCLQIYTARHFDGTVMGKSGRPYHAYGGLCLECEGYADGANNPALGDIMLRPGQTQRHTTSYAFSTY